ncbi:O-antigen ligase [Chitinophaga niastensis]|uniref:O-antigen ligase n=1 Tax=Chitinophaga niastensis TaxID=536980 RepID=A0A2P8HFB7_CHINA|nr:O-antigen ligase family protein [Chitinophaga niastensis]PSL44900.1 O-antigen ligase [Chitinophaga niastensis]
MKPLHVKILVSLFILSLLFLNKEWLVMYGWGISFLMYLAFFLDLQKIKHFDFSQNIHGYRMFPLAMLALLSVIWAPDGEATLLHTLMLFVTILNSFVLYYFVVRYNLFSLIVYLLLGYSFINYSLALGLPYFGFLQNHDEEMARFIGTELNPNYLAIMLLFSMFLSLLFFQERSSSSKALKGLHIINIVLALYTIFLTASRKGITFSFLLLFLYGLINFKRMMASFKTILIVGLAGSLVLFFVKIDFVTDTMGPAFERLGRMLSTMGGKSNEGSTEERVMFIREGWIQFTASPFIGYGAASFKYYYHLYAHNNYIELLFGVGFLGPLIYYSIHFSILRKLWEHRTGAFLAAFVLILMLMDVGLVSYYDKRVMLMLLFIIVLADRKIAERKAAKQLTIPAENRWEQAIFPEEYAHLS